MNDFEVVKTLTTGVRFKVLEAYAKKLQLQVVLKQCDCSKDEEAEFFIRSALMKVKDNIYSQPLLSIFADIDQATSKMCVVFVWRKGNAVDPEVEWDRESRFPSGKAGFEQEQVRVTYKSPLTTVAIKQAHCLTLGKHVTLKVSTDMDMHGVNSALKEALGLAYCTHPNVCEILDFRLHSTKKGKYRTYIVMELLNRDLAKEIEERKLLAQPYGESELLEILLNLSSALVYLKSLNIAHRYIKPSNILRASQGSKLSDLGSTWMRELHSGTTPYMSPEARTMNTPAVPFEGDVFSLGMSLLHLAALQLPATEVGISEEELHALLQREVNSLQYSDGFKRLLGCMLSVSLNSRPSIETVREDAISIYRQVPKGGNLRELPADMLTLESQSIVSQKQKADQLVQQAVANFEAEKYAEADELHAAAHAIYSRLSDDEATASNLMNWGRTLRGMENNSEAERKHAAADALYSHFPSDSATALNFRHWGNALNNMANYAEADRKHAVADAIFSYFPNDKGTADNLNGWGIVLYNMKNYAEAEKKFAQAHAIYSHFFPNDKETASVIGKWGDTLKDIGKDEEALSKYSEAEAIYSRIPIMTQYYIMNWVGVLKKMGNKEKALRVFAEAATRYSLHSNKQIAAQLLYDWACLLKEMENYEEASKKFEAADTIYSALFSNNINTAVNLNEWGHALLKSYHYEEATRKFAAADSILFRLCPNSLDSAVNTSNWAYSLCEKGDYEEGLRKFAAADAIFSHLPRDIYVAENFYLWGNALCEIGNDEESEKQFAAADSIYSRHSLNERTAENLYSWGGALYRMGRRMEAVAKNETARQVFVLLGKSADTEDCDKVTAMLIYQYILQSPLS